MKKLATMIGQVISHYKILEKLGEGGMGIVYKAHDTKLDRDVALKFLPTNLTTDPAARERFIHEAKAASALSHPNICGIHAIEEFEQQHFIDMEFLEGKTLGELLKEKELSLKEIVGIVLQIAQGLNAAHKKGIVHRDIKPDNIMVTSERLVKIMDFGLAKLKGSSKLTRTHSTLGTLSYMSPEQACGEEIDQRTDIFSLGAVLYEMVTGRQPFKGEHEAAIMYSVMNETPDPLARYKTDVPDELQRVIDKALAKEREKRYQHVDEMEADLRSVIPTLSSNIKSVTRRSKVLWVVAASVIAIAVLSIYFFYPKSGPTSANSKTIAVLPFNNMNGNQEDEYFSDGIMEDILTQLSKIADLNVISRTTMMQYKSTKKSLKEIGKELNAGVVLEGSVRHSGNRIRISSQLIDAEADRHIWAETYDREMKDVFVIQSDVAKQIAAALQARLSPGEKERIEKKQTENTEAYQIYLKGRFYWNKRTAVDMQKAIEYFNQAIEKDPHYALAYAGLASSTVLLPQFGFPAKEYYSKSKDAAIKALKIDSSLAEAYAVLGSIKQCEFDWTNSERAFKRAIELNPSYPTAHHWYSILLGDLKRFDEALAESRRAEELDPLSLMINLNVGMTLFYIRQYDQAINQCKRTIELDPNFPWSYYIIGWTYEAQGKFEEAIKQYQKAKMHTSGGTEVLSDIGRCCARAGRRNDALTVLNELLNYSRKGYSVAYDIASVYYGLGDKGKTFEWLEKSFQNQETSIADLNCSQLWDSLRADPRFIALLKKMGLGN